jgi:hypothetical protein
MTFGQLKSEVKLILGFASQTTHPFVSPTDYTTNWVNRALVRIARMLAASGRDVAQILPHFFATWEGVTVNNGAYVDVPTNALTVREVYSFDKTSADENRDKGRLLPEISPAAYEVMARDTTVVGFPRMWTRRANRIYLFPIPTTAYLTDLHIHGTKKESTLSGDASVAILGEEWEDITVLEAARIGATEMGWFEAAKQFHDQVLEQVSLAPSIAAQHDYGDDDLVEVRGSLTDFWELYP